MQLFNVLSRRLETFYPSADSVTLYVCGITPYDTTHLGHCFTYTSFDILVRYLEFTGQTVRYVQNVTDIDDDILRKARAVDEDWLTLGNRWTTHFIDDNEALNIRPPDRLPRATDVIEEIVAAVQALMRAGVAYEVNGNVYFHVSDDPAYGKLSRLSYEEMLPVANERGNNAEDPNKRDPLDFVLWQAQAPGEPAWDSPWGPGRPGWHIECSTMSTNYLGQPIDIHGGGADLIFPHHESEIAQAECASGRQPFTRFWLHTAMVRFQGEKMSKSLGNLVMVRDLLEEGCPADAIRLCMAGHHYRQPWSYDEDDVTLATNLVNKFNSALSVSDVGRSTVGLEPARSAFLAAMDNDLDTPAARQALIDLADAILEGASHHQSVAEAQQSLRELAGILGLRLDQPGPEERVTAGWQAHRAQFIP